EDVAEPLAVGRHEDTSGNTELFAPPLQDAGRAGALLADLTQRAHQNPGRGAQTRGLTDGLRDLQQVLAEKDERLEQLRPAVVPAPDSTDASTGGAGPLTAELAHRDAQIAELHMAVERLEEAA